MLRLHRILMDKIDDTGSPSGYGAETSTTATPTQTTETQGSDNIDPKGDTSGEGTKVETPTAGDKSKQTPTEDVTGYTKPTETPKEEAKPALELDLKGLPEESVKDIQDLAADLGLTKEQAQALVDKRKSEEDAKVTAQETYKVKEAEVFKNWESELKADPDFGGDNFAHSVHNVNKLIREDLPGLKNLLTTSGKRLPPSVMKDLNNVARKLYGETELVVGDKTSAKDSWNPLDFYKQKT